MNIKGKLYPSVNAIVRRSSRLLRNADGVVTTSHGTPGVFRRHGITGPKIIFQYHGCGDRKYGFEASLGKMDLMLLPGAYHRKRLAEEGIVDPGRTRIVGWPKFDITSGDAERPFSNTRPTVLYCPTGIPHLGSYRDLAGRSFPILPGILASTSSSPPHAGEALACPPWIPDPFTGEGP